MWQGGDVTENLILSVLLLLIVVLSIPVVLALFAAACLYEVVNGGQRVSLTGGIDFKTRNEGAIRKTRRGPGPFGGTTALRNRKMTSPEMSPTP